MAKRKLLALVLIIIGVLVIAYAVAQFDSESGYYQNGSNTYSQGQADWLKGLGQWFQGHNGVQNGTLSPSQGAALEREGNANMSLGYDLKNQGTLEMNNAENGKILWAVVAIAGIALVAVGVYEWWVGREEEEFQEPQSKLIELFGEP